MNRKNSLNQVHTILWEEFRCYNDGQNPDDLSSSENTSYKSNH